jgi:hypothetical protein
MPKILCLTGLVVSGLIALLFLMDLGFGMLGIVNLAPFKMISPLMDAVMLVSSVVLGVLSWTSLRELK